MRGICRAGREKLRYRGLVGESQQFDISESEV